MSFNATVYRVLIASPGDLDEERSVIEGVVHAWNASHAMDENTVLLPVRWETHSVPEYGDRAQAILNRRLVADCDLLIGAFWTKVGTPTGGFDSGTVEEIEQITRAGKPALLYFSSRQIDPARVDLDELKRVRELKARIQQHALTADFSSPAQLEARLTTHLIAQMRRFSRPDESGAPAAAPIATREALRPEAQPVPAPAPTAAQRPTDKASLEALYTSYWSAFAAALEQAGTRLRAPTPSSGNYVRFSLGVSGVRMNAFTSMRDRLIGVELVLGSPAADAAFGELQENKAEIERELGHPLEWNAQQASNRIALSARGFDPVQREDWRRQHAWLIEKLEAFQRVLVSRVENLRK